MISIRWRRCSKIDFSSQNKVLDGEMFMLQQMRLRFLKLALESDEALNHVERTFDDDCECIVTVLERTSHYRSARSGGDLDITLPHPTYDV